MTPDFQKVIAANEASRRDTFLAAANRIGTPIQNVEKDFWVCWTLDVLFNGLAKPPRLLFKGGTSLSKGYGLIPRFSEDIDITVFREDIGQAASIGELEALSGKKRKARLEAIREACQAYIGGPLREELSQRLNQTIVEAGISPKRGRVEPDEADETAQSLLVWYPTVESAPAETYIRSAVKIESGAKSALDPHEQISVSPYIQEELSELDLHVPNVTTVLPKRTFWDKVIILHGLRSWFERRGELHHGGQRVSRHYYDVYKLMNSEAGQRAMHEFELGRDCARHARMFFNRADYDLEHAEPGTLKIQPSDDMKPSLLRDYQRMSGMIFGDVPAFEDILVAISTLERRLNLLEASCTQGEKPMASPLK